MCIVEKFYTYMINKVLFVGAGVFLMLLAILPYHRFTERKIIMWGSTYKTL